MKGSSVTGKSLRTLAIADAVVGAVLFVLAWVFADTDQGAGQVLGAIGWFGFWLCVLAMIAIGVFWFVRVRRRPAAA
jgi:hypothetical protein